MATRRTHPVQRRVLVDEAFLEEWIIWGFKELDSFLALHAAFAQWCIIHHRQEGDP
jgi:hypothetical protein